MNATRYILILEVNRHPFVTSKTEINIEDILAGKKVLIAAPMQEKITTKLQI